MDGISGRVGDLPSSAWDGLADVMQLHWSYGISMKLGELSAITVMVNYCGRASEMKSRMSVFFTV